MGVLDVALLARARARQLSELLKETRLFSRRAIEPEDRAALAEIERELINVQERWHQAGLTTIEVEEEPVDV